MALSKESSKLGHILNEALMLANLLYIPAQHRGYQEQKQEQLGLEALSRRYQRLAARLASRQKKEGQTPTIDQQQ